MAGAIISPTSENWGTPYSFFNKLEERYGVFDLDAAAGDDWNMCPNYITKEMDALNPLTPWNGNNIFVNPPYGKWIPLFLNRALKELVLTTEFKSIVFLIPAKTDTKWYHDICLKKAKEILFVQGRLSFRLPGKKNTATFASIIVQFTNEIQTEPVFGRIRNK